jgi:hypothetical protein
MYRLGMSRARWRLGEGIMTINTSFGIRFLLAAMMALAVAVTGCGTDSGGTAGTGGGGSGGTGGGGGMVSGPTIEMTAPSGGAAVLPGAAQAAAAVWSAARQSR